MAELNIIAPPKTVVINIALEPVYSALQSLEALNIVEKFSGLGEWVEQTAKLLTPERRRANELVFEPLYDATMPEKGNWPNFPAYLDGLAAEDPTAMRDRVIKGMYEKCCAEESADSEKPDPVVLLADRQAYLEYVESFYRAKDALEHFDRSLYEEGHALLNDPPALKAFILAHLRTMWDEYLAAEWARVEPMLRESVAAFQKLDYSGLSTAETFRRITGRPLPEVWQEFVNEAETITFVPSAHYGPYLSLYPYEKRLRVIFGARIPEGARASSPSLSRSELLVRLNALADDTRLRILQLLSEGEELRAQDFIERLDLSQSAASRHLLQLVATGFLSERRQDGAKVYRLNRERIDDTCHALRQFVG